MALIFYGKYYIINGNNSRAINPKQERKKAMKNITGTIQGGGAENI